MTRKEWLVKLGDFTIAHKPQNETEAEAMTEALVSIASAAFASWHRVGSDSIAELTNAAYTALQDKAEEIKTRN